MPHYKLLVVEDDVHVAAVLETRLRTFGYEVCGIAPSGAAAVRNAFEHRPDLILMDILLEGDMNGIEAAEFIHNIMDVPIVFVSCLNDQKMLDRAIRTNVYGYLRKPYDIAELKYTLQIALRQHAAIEKKRLMGNSNLNYGARKEETRTKEMIQLLERGEMEKRAEHEEKKSRDGLDLTKNMHPSDYNESLSGIQLLLSLMLKSDAQYSAVIPENEVINRDDLGHQRNSEYGESSLKERRKGLRSFWDKMKDRISKSRLSFSLQRLE
ncbi:MAG: response regulator [Desulfobacteraceae bacterium]|nr:MAG: response regulator [Desulfobacteraceae bacterium]